MGDKWRNRHEKRFGDEGKMEEYKKVEREVEERWRADRKVEQQRLSG